MAVIKFGTIKSAYVMNPKDNNLVLDILVMKNYALINLVILFNQEVLIT